MDYDEIGRRIRSLRKARGLSQEALAEKANISAVHMSHIETGHTRLSLPVFADLASALSVRADELLYGPCAAAEETSAARLIRMLDGCTPQQIQMLETVFSAAKAVLDGYK